MNITVQTLINFSPEEDKLLEACDNLRMAELLTNEYADTFGASELAFQEGAYGEAQAARFEILEQICRKIDDLVIPDWERLYDRVKVRIDDLALDEVLGGHRRVLYGCVRDLVQELFEA